MVHAFNSSSLELEASSLVYRTGRATQRNSVFLKKTTIKVLIKEL